MGQQHQSYYSKRHLCWDEQNRLQGVMDEQSLAVYQYDANGDRTYKLTGKHTHQNISGTWHHFYQLDNATLYASPYLVVTPKGYTKHYYAESERVASKLGNGGLLELDYPLVAAHLVGDKFVANTEHAEKVIYECLHAEDARPSAPLSYLYELMEVSQEPENERYWYHPDHLGSSSWITFSDGEAVQHLHYLPFGEDLVNQQLTVTGALFTFSAKEKDSETGFSYFGSRYYNSDLSIWLSVDPMSDKYPSMSSYVYCANNPIKLVDPNGEEIWIVGDDGVRYKYNNGNFYTKEGNIYTPESGSFLSKAGNAIDKLKGTKTGNRLIGFFEGSDNKDVIIESDSKSTCDNLTLDSESGEFISQTIRWNSEGTNIETTAGEQKNSTADLGHEFSHVYDNAKNIKGLRDLCPNKGSRSEWRAVYRENCMREEMGLPYRTGYTFRNPDNSTYFVSMLNRKGKPYMPNSFQWTPFEVCKKKTY